MDRYGRQRCNLYRHARVESIDTKRLIKFRVWYSSLSKVFFYDTSDSFSTLFYDDFRNTQGPFKEKAITYMPRKAFVSLLRMVALDLGRTFGGHLGGAKLLVVVGLLVYALLDLLVIQVRVRGEWGKVEIVSGSKGCHGD